MDALLPIAVGIIVPNREDLEAYEYALRILTLG